MRLNRILILCAAIFFMTPSYALFCPTNFNQIEIGDSLEAVLRQCGKPDKQEDAEKEAPAPQEWSYYVQQTVAINLGSKETSQGSLKTTVMFDKEGKAVNISINGMGVGSSNLCGKLIKLGDTSDQVKANCGNPSIVNKQDTSSSYQPPAKTKVTTCYYNSTPPKKLIFENGKLTSIE